MTACRRFWIALVATLFLSGISLAHDPPFTSEFDRGRCTFSSTGSNPYLPLWPGYALLLEGEEESDGEIVDIEAQVTVLNETELVDGVLTRVVEERESEDGELVEVSRNFMALCRETGDVWYFGEDVDDYEDGVIVGHGGAWRTGVAGAKPGILMLGTPVAGARYHQELAPGVAEDRGEVVEVGGEATVPVGTFDQVLSIVDTNPLSTGGGEGDLKLYAYGVGLIKDEDLELVEITPPLCQPDQATHCLNGGRFKVTAEWEDSQGNSGHGAAILPSDDGGAFSFFGPNNPEVLVKVLNGCGVPGFNSFWVFAGGVTNVGVTLTVEDTENEETKVYRNLVGAPFAPVLDTSAFADCP
jgi:hypothetical protein